MTSIDWLKAAQNLGSRETFRLTLAEQVLARLRALGYLVSTFNAFSDLKVSEMVAGGPIIVDFTLLCYSPALALKEGEVTGLDHGVSFPVRGGATILFHQVPNRPDRLLWRAQVTHVDPQ